MKSSEWAEGVYEEFIETYDFQTCQRPDGSYYGTGGTCRKGVPATKPKKEKVKKKRAKKAEAADAGGGNAAPKKAGPGDFAKGGKLKGAEKNPSGDDNVRTANTLRKRIKEAEARAAKIRASVGQ